MAMEEMRFRLFMLRHFISRSFQKLHQRKEGWRQAARHSSKRISADKESNISIESESSREQDGKYAPRGGLPGKNVEWVPCSPVVLDKMLELAKVTPEDYVIDPGSGDGRIVIRAAKLGARAVGVEFNPKLVALAERDAESEGVGDKASFVIGDFFDYDFSSATVVTLFLRKDLNIALREKILVLKPGTRVVSNIFDMGDWLADETIKVEDENYYFKNHTVHLWVVPAGVAGTWKLPDGELRLIQNYQVVEGTFVLRGFTLPVTGRISGERITISIEDQPYTGKVSGDRMELATGKLRWSAVRNHGVEGMGKEISASIMQ
jgi:SAM-dependent methyltransferase